MKFKREISLAVPNDAPAIVSIQQVVALATYPNKENNITEKDVEYLNSKLEPHIPILAVELEINPNLHIWKATVGAKIAGFALVREEHSRNVLGSLYVLPEYQGDAIGKDLLTQALNFMGTDKDACLDVVSYNTKAIAMYERRGFIKGDIYENPHAVLEDGRFLPEVWMVKKAEKNSNMKYHVYAKILGECLPDKPLKLNDCRIKKMNYIHTPSEIFLKYQFVMLACSTTTLKMACITLYNTHKNQLAPGILNLTI